MERFLSEMNPFRMGSAPIMFIGAHTAGQDAPATTGFAFARKSRS
jgi:hypothetical protein